MDLTIGHAGYAAASGRNLKRYCFDALSGACDNCRMHDEQTLPTPVLQRLPGYLSTARALRAAGESWAPSRQLAAALGLTTSTVRQDMSHLDIHGVSKRGYAIDELESVLGQMLHVDRTHPTVIIGAGRMGTALAQHGALAGSGFEICAIFDTDPAVLGTKIGSLTVRPQADLRRICKRRHVKIGVIAVPASVAQDVASRLVKAGVKGILNFANVHLKVPEEVVVSDVRLVARLQELAFAIGATHA